MMTATRWIHLGVLVGLFTLVAQAPVHAQRVRRFYSAQIKATVDDVYPYVHQIVKSFRGQNIDQVILASTWATLVGVDIRSDHPTYCNRVVYSAERWRLRGDYPQFSENQYCDAAPTSLEYYDGGFIDERVVDFCADPVPALSSADVFELPLTPAEKVEGLQQYWVGMNLLVSNPGPGMDYTNSGCFKFRWRE